MSREESPGGSGAGMPLRFIEFLPREIEERRCQQNEHNQAEEVAGGERTQNLRAEGEEIGTPGQPEYRSDPMRHMRRDFGVLQKIDDDAEQAEYSPGGNQAARIERSRAGFAFLSFLGRRFDEPTHQAAGEHGGSGPN